MAQGKSVQVKIIKENNQKITDVSSANKFEEQVVYDGRLVPESAIREKGVDTNSGVH